MAAEVVSLLWVRFPIDWIQQQPARAFFLNSTRHNILIIKIVPIVCHSRSNELEVPRWWTLTWVFLLLLELELTSQCQYNLCIMSTIYMFVQGDHRDIFHLRKNLLRATLGYLDYKVCWPWIPMEYWIFSFKYDCLVFRCSKLYFCYQSID